MRRLLRNKITKEFFAQGCWTRDQRLGHDFPTTQAALETCNQLQLKDMEIVLEIGPDPSHAYDVVMPISAPPTPEAPQSEQGPATD